MPSRSDIVNAIYAAIDEMNEQQPKGRQIEKTPETALFGEKGMLDSLGLVNLIVAVEQQLEDELGVTVTLADEKAISQRNSPFRTVDSLADYIETQVAGA